MTSQAPGDNITGYKLEIMSLASTNGRFITIFEGKLNCLDECHYLVSDSSIINPGEGYMFRVTGIY